MSKRSTPTDKILVDPLFAIPEGAEDQFVFSREGTDEDFTTDEGEDIAVDSVDSGFEDGESLDFDDGYDDQNGITLETPENFSVISQVIRRAPGGQQVVDIVIQSEDIDGAINYEIQVTKI